MKQEVEEIRNQQKATWNEFSGKWKKWDDLLMTSLKPLRDETIRLLDVKETDSVLDVASGTGEPGLSLAGMLKNGKVILTDLSENMLQIASENASKRGIKNIETRVCDACELPFADNTFDAVSCRLGFMLFPNVRLASMEMYRVLKPGGRIAVSVWNVPEKNFWATALAGAIFRNLQLQPPPAEAPGLFRCAKSGFVQDLFRQAGFKNTSEIEVACILDFGSTDVYWNMITDVTAPLALALRKADDNMKEKIKQEVYQIINQKYPNGNVRIDGSALVIYGAK